MPYSRISHIAFSLPKMVLADEDLQREHPDWDVGRISRKSGITSRCRVTDSETALDLGVSAAERLFDETGFSRDHVDALIFCTQHPDYILPPNSCLAHHRLHLRSSIPVYDLCHGCAGFVSALSMADSLIRSAMANHVLVITGDTYSKHMNPNDRTVQTLFGDGGAATLVSSCEQEAIGPFAFDTDGSGAKNLIVPMSGARTGVLEGTADPTLRGPADLFMNGREIMVFALRKVPELMEQTLSKANIAIDGVDFFVFHQANKFMLESLRSICDIPEDKFIINMGEIGNTVSASIPIALRMAQDCGTIKNGMKVFLIGFGVGYECAATLATL